LVPEVSNEWQQTGVEVFAPGLPLAATKYMTDSPQAAVIEHSVCLFTTSKRDSTVAAVIIPS